MYEHGLQTATRAHAAGADEETVVVALLHDIGEVLSPVNHGEVAAGLLRPYISPESYFILMHHEVFQAFYYGDAAGVEKHTREQFRHSPHFDACERFCLEWDQSSFDPGFQSQPVEDFVPMVRRILSRKPYAHPDHTDDPVNAAKRALSAAYPE